MAKIIASVSKKIPVPGIPFSNQQFGGSLEVDLPDGVTDEQLQTRLQELYALLGQTVEGEIAAAVEATRSNPSTVGSVGDEGGRREESRFRRPEEDRGGGFRNGQRGPGRLSVVIRPDHPGTVVGMMAPTRATTTGRGIVGKAVHVRAGTTCPPGSK